MHGTYDMYLKFSQHARQSFGTLSVFKHRFKIYYVNVNFKKDVFESSLRNCF